MTRKKVEAMMKAMGLKRIDIFPKAEDEIAIYCVMNADVYLRDYTYHSFCGMNDDLDSYLVWLSGGNADRVKFDNSEDKTPFMRNGLRVQEAQRYEI